MKYVVLDLETNGTETFKRFCNPLDPRHSIELSCIRYPDNRWNVYWRDEEGRDDREWIVHQLVGDNPAVIVGQNIKFDLLWLWEEPALQEWFRQGGLVWDTQTVEYLLQGQTKEKRNLDVLSTKYKGTIKDDRIGALYKEGKQSKDIDRDMLLEYCKHDVLNTEKVFIEQQKAAARERMLPLLETYMRHYVAVIEMEYNGMHVNKTHAWATCSKLESKLNSIMATLVKTVPKNCWDSRIEFNPSSSRHVSSLLFGTPLPFVDDIPQVDEEGNELFYKSGTRKGQQKTKKGTVMITPNSMKYVAVNKVGKSGWYSVDAKVLNELCKQKSVHTDYLEKLLEYREVSKLLGTYYYKEEKISKNKTKVSGNLSLVMPHTGCMHTEFKTAMTRTGRLASRNPNIQNLSPSCLDIFDSRFENGKLLEIDFSQLEVCVAAVMANDVVLMEEIEKGLDLHLENAKFLFKCDTPTAKQRKISKQVTFGILYGQYYLNLASRFDLDEENTKDYVDFFYNKYTGIKDWHDSLEKQVKESATTTEALLPIRDKKTGQFIKLQSHKQKVGHFISGFGKKYVVTSLGSLTDRGVFEYMPLPEIKNYGVQGTASDIVALFVGQVYSELCKHREHVRIVNEVHDSLILDIKEDKVPHVLDLLKDLCKELPSSIEKRFGFNWPLPLNIDHSVGNNWKECKENE